MNDISIYILTHKDFTPLVKSDVYKIVTSNDLSGKYDLEVIKSENTTGTPLDDKFWSELLQMKFVIDKCDLPEYVGFCHYRRYFAYLYTIPDFGEDVCIAPKKWVFPCSVREQYKACHNIEDLEIMGEVIKDKYPDYYDDYVKYLNGNFIYPWNMFIMHKSRLNEYRDFIFGAFDGYFKKVGTDIHKRIEENKEKYSHNRDLNYQYRIGGYAGERLT
jgi:hypothetical protein